MTDCDLNHIKDTFGGNEIITICVGEAGIFMGNAFYSTIMNEHKIDKTGNSNDILITSKINTYFKNGRENKYSPRALFIDIDKTPVDMIRSSPLGLLIDDNNLLSGSYNESTVIWPKGHYIEGAEYIDNVMDNIRNEIEICDYFQGWNMIHSLCGGWSSGFGTLLLQRLCDNYPDKNGFTYNLYPYNRGYCVNNHNPDFSVYNAILAIHQIIENVNLCFVMDNGKLLEICQNQCKLRNPSYDDINWLISLILSGITSTFRFDTEPTLCTNMKRMYTNFTLFPRLKFLTSAHSPFFSYYHYKYNRNINQIIKDSINNIISPIKIEDGRILNYMLCYKSINDENVINRMNKFVSNLYMKRSDDFITFITDPVESCFVYDGNNECYAKYTPLISTSIIHTTAIKGLYQMLSAQFAKLMKKKASIHWYRGEGMDDMEFQEADKNIRDLICEYQDMQESVSWN